MMKRQPARHPLARCKGHQEAEKHQYKEPELAVIFIDVLHQMDVDTNIIYCPGEDISHCRETQDWWIPTYY